MGKWMSAALEQEVEKHDPPIKLVPCTCDQTFRAQLAQQVLETRDRTQSHVSPLKDQTNSRLTARSNPNPNHWQVVEAL